MNSLTLVAEGNENIVGFISTKRGFAKRINQRAYIVIGIIGILKDYIDKYIGRKLFEKLEE